MRSCRPALVLIVFVSIPLQYSLAAVEGRVWLDANGNGRLDAGEQGVAGCLVSNGTQLVRTDADGHYRLEPCSNPTAVFVINRSGTWPIGPWWKGADNASPSATIDFALQEQRQDGPLIFAQGTDIHLRSQAVPHYRKYIEHLNALPLPLQFVVHTGDLVVDALPRDVTEAQELFRLYESETEAIRRPLRNLPGNHEHVGAAVKGIADRSNDYGKGMYIRRLGPSSYAFRYGPYHFLALDGTTLDPQAKNGYVDRPDDTSVAWATRYLATVGPDEPLIVLVHQPLANRDTDRQLLAALEGKRLLAVLCGHGHNRSVTTWGGAPMIMGGAVSYAWHGLLPYPPDPWGYVVYRLDDSRLEYTYLDWAAERSVDLKSPAWRTIAASPRLNIDGTVSDFDGSVRGVICRLGSSRADARLTRVGHLVDHFEAMLDVSELADGVYDLTIDVTDGSHTCCHTRPLIVTNGRHAPLAEGGPGTQPARLKVQVAGTLSDDNEVRFNGQPLVRGSVSKRPSQEWSFELPSDRLQRLNQITIVPGERDSPEASRLRIERDGRAFGDIRFSPSMKRKATRSGPTSGAADYYIDLTYPGPRGKP